MRIITGSVAQLLFPAATATGDNNILLSDEPRTAAAAAVAAGTGGAARSILLHYSLSLSLSEVS